MADATVLALPYMKLKKVVTIDICNIRVLFTVGWCGSVPHEELHWIWSLTVTRVVGYALFAYGGTVFVLIRVLAGVGFCPLNPECFANCACEYCSGCSTTESTKERYYLSHHTPYAHRVVLSLDPSDTLTCWKHSIGYLITWISVCLIALGWSLSLLFHPYPWYFLVKAPHLPYLLSLHSKCCYCVLPAQVTSCMDKPQLMLLLDKKKMILSDDAPAVAAIPVVAAPALAKENPDSLTQVASIVVWLLMA